MNASSYLRSYGWKEGEALKKGGLRKPILVKHKKDTKGLGSDGNDSDMWWERLFDGQLKNFEVTSNEKGVTVIQNEAEIANHMRKANSPLYRMFVRGEGLAGTVGKTDNAHVKSTKISASGVIDKTVGSLKSLDTSKKERKEKKYKKERKEKKYKKEEKEKEDKKAKKEKKDKKEKKEMRDKKEENEKRDMKVEKKKEGSKEKKEKKSNKEKQKEKDKVQKKGEKPTKEKKERREKKNDKDKNDQKRITNSKAVEESLGSNLGSTSKKRSSDEDTHRSKRSRSG